MLCLWWFSRIVIDAGDDFVHAYSYLSLSLSLSLSFSFSFSFKYSTYSCEIVVISNNNEDAIIYRRNI